VPVLAPGAWVSPGQRVIAHLSRGDALDVYDVWSEERDCRCIAKLPRPDRVGGRTEQRLREEARLLLGFTHPHIVRAYALLEGSPPVLLLETLTGVTVGRLLERKRLKAREAANLGRHVCSAIGYLHRRGVLHLDLKPDNLVAQGGLAKVLDLSLAAPPGARRRGAGTPLYMAPEQVRGGELSAATDVWGIGAVLYEGLTGQPPRRLSDLRVRTLRLPRSAPRELREVVRGALERRVAARPTLAELSEACEAVAG
jgi:serine/threonine protein kinase